MSYLRNKLELLNIIAKDLHFVCTSPLLGNSNFLKNVCPTYGEENAVKIKLRDCVRVYRQRIRQLEYQKLKGKEHLRTCGKGIFKIFL